MPGDADLQRIVETKFVLQDDLTEKLGSMHEEIKKLAHEEKKAHEETAKLGEKFEQLGEKVEGTKERVLQFAAGFGVALGGMELAKKFVEANADAERLERTMGALVSVNYQYSEAGKKLDPAANFQKSMETGRKMHEEFQGAAEKYGLSTSHLAEAAGLMMPAFARAKISTKEAGEEVVKLGRLSQITGHDLASTSQALDMFLMSGMASKRNPVFAMLGLTSMPEGKFTAEQRFEKLQKGISKFNIDSMKGVVTFDDRVQMLKARLEHVYEVGGKPFFEEAVKMAGDMADWLDKNKTYVEEIAKTIANKFVTGLKIAGDLLKFAAENAVAIGAALTAVVSTSKITSFFGGIAESLEKMKKASEDHKGSESIGKAIGVAANAAMLLEAAAIGVAIGTAINKMIEPDVQGYMSRSVEGKETWTDRVADATQKALFGGSLGDVAKITDYFEGGDKQRKRDEANQGFLDKLSHNDRWDDLAHVAGRMDAAYQQSLEAPAIKGSEAAKDQPPNYNFPNARFDIRQEFSPGFDPDRIAVALSNGISKLGERKLQSQYGHALTGVR